MDREEERDSDGALSRHSSITHPYRSLLSNASFPRCHLVNTPDGRTDSFVRSILPLGHGYPLWDPIGNINRPQSHLKSGIRIGDVGLVSQDGNFKYYFNIFVPPGDPIQHWCPPGLEPLNPPLDPSEILVNPKYFPSGTVLLSKGVSTSRLSESPLDLQFNVNARDGAVIVLPDGASREDLVSNSRLLPYVRKHALEWYHFINEGRADQPEPNGTLYLVTGCDKSNAWAIASCSQYSGRTGKELTMRYQRANTSEPWDLGSHGSLARFDGECPPNTQNCALFIRGMRIAVNPSLWAKSILQNQPPRFVPHFNLLSTPILGLRAKILTMIELWKGFPEEDLPVRTEIVFHPLIVVCRILLNESPAADVAIAEDTLWASVSDKNSDGTLAEVIKQLSKLLETYNMSTDEGLVTLKLKVDLSGDSAPASQNVFSHLPDRIKNVFKTRQQRKENLLKIEKALPGPDHKEKPVSP